jgi:hypothetical protein
MPPSGYCNTGVFVAGSSTDFCDDFLDFHFADDLTAIF